MNLQVQTLIVGVQGAGSLPQPLPAAFFRPLQLLVAMQAAGYPYQPPTLAQLRSGAPQPGWCLPALLFSASDEQAGGGAGSAAAPPTPAALHSTAKQLLGQWSYAAPVYTYTESGSWRCPGSINPSVVASQLDDARWGWTGHAWMEEGPSMHTCASAAELSSCAGGPEAVEAA